MSRWLRSAPIGAFSPCRAAVAQLGRTHPLRVASTFIVQQGMRAFRGRLADRIVEVRPLDWPGLTFEPTDSPVIERVYWFGVGGYEGLLTRIWARLCRRADRIVEVGGNVGLFSVIGAKSTAGAYTVVEPLPENAEVLRRNLARNGVQCQVLQAAAIPGLDAKVIEISIPDEGRAAPVGASLVVGSEVRGRSELRTLEVDGLPFASLIAGSDLIKIDAEGVEAELLESAFDQIVARRPTLVIEVLPESQKLAAVIRQLARTAGYRISIVPAYGAHKITEVAPEAFTSTLPARYNSKDVVLSLSEIASIAYH